MEGDHWALDLGLYPIFTGPKPPQLPAIPGFKVPWFVGNEITPQRCKKTMKNITVNNLVLFLDSAKYGRLGHPLFFPYVILFINCR
jgi:hypothetical protein